MFCAKRRETILPQRNRLIRVNNNCIGVHKNTEFATSCNKEEDRIKREPLPYSYKYRLHRCRNARDVDPKSSYATPPTTPTTNKGSTECRVSALKNGSSNIFSKKYRVHWPKDIYSVNDDLLYGITREDITTTPTLPVLKNGHATATGTSIEMSTTSSTTRVTRKIVSQKFQLGSGDGSYVSTKSYDERAERLVHPGYRNRTFVSETVESGSGKSLVSEKRKEMNGSTLSTMLSSDEDDNDDEAFLHRKTSNFRRRYTSDLGQAEQSFASKALNITVASLNKILSYIYGLIVSSFVLEKLILKIKNSTYREDQYYHNKRMGYASNGTNINEGTCSKFRHLFFSDKKLASNLNDSVERRNVMVYNNSNENSATKTTYNNSRSQHNENHLSEEEHFNSSFNRSRGLVGKCLKIFLALLLMAIIGYLVYLLQSPISSYASATLEFVGSCLSSLITQTVGLLSSLGSLSLFGSGKTAESIVNIPSVPVTEENANVQTAPIINPTPTPIPPIISKEQLDDILSRLKFLEDEVVHHNEKFVMYDGQYSALKVQITQLELAMQEASAKGKTPEQILNEIMNFHLGQTSDGKVVTLTNLVTLWNTKTQDETSTLDMKLRNLAIKIAAGTDASKSDTDQLKTEINEIKERQIQTEEEIKVLNKPVEVDMKKLHESILPVLMAEVGNQVQISCATRDCPEPAPGGGIVGGTQEDMEKLIKMAIARYDADKTGLPDLALESAGGTILSTRCTKSSKLRNSVVSFFGFKIWSPPNNPRTIIQPGVVPGECWAFEGSVGDIVVQLVAPSIVTGFTVEHIPKSVSPYGNIDSAPYKFEVWGLNAENDFDTMWNYGTFSYEDNGDPLQYFPVQNANANAYPIVELKILSNHGNLRHTCLYRFRVHGSLDMKVMNVKIEPHTSEV